MSFKTAAFGLCLLGALASCTVTNHFNAGDSAGAIPGVNVGDEPTDVIAVLGPPKDRATGWWEGGVKFDPEYEVWFYKGTGRVIFASRPQKRVYTTESDPAENGRSWGPGK